MKKIVILILSIFVVYGASAQKYRDKVYKPEYNTSIGLSLSHIADASLHLSYETAISGRASLGGYVNYRFSKTFLETDTGDIGFEIAPTIKYYLSGQANNHGFYAQMGLIVGYYFDVESWDRTVEGKYGAGAPITQSSFVYGVGPRLGYLFKFPNPHWGVDISAGWKICKNYAEWALIPQADMDLYTTVGALKIIYRF